MPTEHPPMQFTPELDSALNGLAVRLRDGNDYLRIIDWPKVAESDADSMRKAAAGMLDTLTETLDSAAEVLRHARPDRRTHRPVADVGDRVALREALDEALELADGEAPDAAAVLLDAVADFLGPVRLIDTLAVLGRRLDLANAKRLHRPASMHFRTTPADFTS